jgi:hypothetical protein
MNARYIVTKPDFERKLPNMAKKKPWDKKAHFRAPRDHDRSCPCGKVRFKDHDHAVSALHSAKNRRKAKKLFVKNVAHINVKNAKAFI